MNGNLKKAAKKLSVIENNEHIIKCINNNAGIRVNRIVSKLRMQQCDVSIRLTNLKKIGIVEKYEQGYYIAQRALTTSLTLNKFANEKR